MKHYEIDFLMHFPGVTDEGYLFLKTDDNELIRSVYGFIHSQAKSKHITETVRLPLLEEEK